MTRKKVELAYIVRDSARRSAYQKRKKGLLKKADELTTLCGIEACAVIYSAYESSPVVWPDKERARRVVEQLQRTPGMDQKRKMYDHAAYLRHRVHKAAKQLTRLRQDNRQKEVAVALRDSLTGELSLDGMNAADLSGFRRRIDVNLEEINRQLLCLGQEEEEEQPQPLQALPASDPESDGGSDI